MKTISHVIGGKSVEVRGGRTAPVFNPATGAQTAEVQLASAVEVDAAVAAARARIGYDGEVAERFNASVLKTVGPSRGP